MSLLGDTTDTRTALLYYLALSENETNDEIDVLLRVIIQLLYDKMEDAHRIRDLETARDRSRRWRSIAGLRRCLGIFETEATAQAQPLLRVRLCVCPDSCLQCASVQQSWSSLEICRVANDPSESCVVCGDRHSPPVFQLVGTCTSTSRPACIFTPALFCGSPKTRSPTKVYE
jgi:hypothetical protein